MAKPPVTRTFLQSDKMWLESNILHRGLKWHIDWVWKQRDMEHKNKNDYRKQEFSKKFNMYLNENY